MTTISAAEVDPGPPLEFPVDSDISEDEVALESLKLNVSTSPSDDRDAARQEEFDSLKAIYADDDIKFKTWEGRLGFKIQFGKMQLEVVTDNTYPDEPPLHISVTGISVLDSIRITASLTDLADDKRGSFQLFDLIEESRTMLNSLSEKSPDSNTDNDFTDDLYNFNIHGCYNPSIYMNGITLGMISQRLRESNVAILHTESVLHPRLVHRFESIRTLLTQKYDTNSRIDEYTATEVVFHGTQRRFIPNIVARGFIKPGDVMNENGDVLQVRCGSTWGRGIYTSPEPSYSMSYSDISDSSDNRIPGQKLIVCTILMGRRNRCSVRCNMEDRAKRGFDSHVSPSGFEYIVFNSGQLLPLYVLHVSDGSQLDLFWGRRMTRGPVNLKKGFDYLAYRNRTGIDEIDESETDLTLTMKRKIMTKIARKHFPHGFGPATGDKFIVEEIGAVDDDEEEWGDYQMDREETDGIGKSHNVLDEFQKARCKDPDLKGIL